MLHFSLTLDALAHRDPAKTYAEVSHAECQAFWSELVELWRGRESAIRYCVAVSDARLAKRKTQVFGESALGLAVSDPRLDADRAVRDELYAEEVKVSAWLSLSRFVCDPVEVIHVFKTFAPETANRERAFGGELCEETDTIRLPCPL